jgi:hypothetical protein
MAMFGSSWNEDDREPGSMFGPKMGYWFVSSRIDSRWNASGRSHGLVCMGGPQDMHTWIEECKAKYGTPPDDLASGFMKD